MDPDHVLFLREVQNSLSAKLSTKLLRLQVESKICISNEFRSLKKRSISEL